MNPIETVTIALSALLAYVYAGYPVLLCVLSRLMPRPHRPDPAHTPSVTLIVSAYNEVGVIRKKLENSLALDYPAGKLTVVVVSDCSDDGTDAEVLSFADRGVRLVRAAARNGKTAALNEAMRQVDSEIVVFSDANAIYDKDAVRNLVRHFADRQVGYVVGHARYREEKETAAGASEGTYWDLEVMIKSWESRFSSVVGGDGAIYAIRTSLYEPMRQSDINDFVNPLQIVAKGYRGLFDPEAFCLEEPAGKFEKEFSRKVRIVNRSFNAVFRVPQACLPWRTGRFSWQLVSHKVLRWFSPYLILLFLAALVLDCVTNPSPVDVALCALAGLFFALAGIGRLLDGSKKPHAVFYLPYYFVLVNVASAIGILLRLRGTTITTWATVRQGEAETAAKGSAGRPALLALCLVLAALLLALLSLRSELSQLTLAALLLALPLAHAFVLYPLLLFPMARLLGKGIRADEGFLPRVTLLIVAYNEGGVIESKLSNSLALDYPKELLHIVVASDGSTDDTNRIVAAYADRGVELLAFPENRGKISALNDAMKAVRSEIVVFSDANVTYDPRSIRKLARNFADPRVGAVSGKVTLLNAALSYGPAERIYYGIEHAIQRHEGEMGTLIGTDGAMYAVRRALFAAPPPDTILDDLVVSLGIARRGHLVVAEPEALGFEENRLEIGGEFRRKARIIAGGYQCLQRDGLFPRWSQPLLMFCFVSHKVLRWASGILFLSLSWVLLRIQYLNGEVAPPLFKGLLALILAAVLLALSARFSSRVRRTTAATLCRYFFMLMAASLVGCYLGVTGRQKVTWRGGEAA